MLNLFVILTSISSLLINLFIGFNLQQGYEFIGFLPLAFMVAYFLAYSSIIKIRQMQITGYILLSISWIRCVLLPLIGTISGVYSVFDYVRTPDSIQMAILLMVYEQIFISVVLLLFLKTKKIFNEKTDKNMYLIGNRFMYIIFIFIALTVFFFWGRNLDLYEFFALSLEGTGRRGDILDRTMLVIRQVISSGMVFLFIVLVDWARKNYYISRKVVFINYAILFGLLLISVITGERRFSVLFQAFAVSWVLIRVFPNKKKKIIIRISIVALIILSLMTVYKSFYAFLSDSYIDAIVGSEINLVWLTQTLESYFYGIRIVARNVEFANINPLRVMNLIGDVARSTFGINYFFRDGILTTSQLYNLSIYGGAQESGHLFSSIAYGYMYLGFFFSPIITFLNIFIAIQLEGLMKKSSSIEMSYIYAIILMRFLFGIFSNPAPMINSGSRMFIISGLIVLVAMIGNKKYYLFNENKSLLRAR